MSGTAEGAAKAVAKIKEKYGEGFFKTIGSAGGKVYNGKLNENGKKLKGFAISGKAVEAGRLGGSNSRRGKAVNKVSKEE